ncbi:MAG: hypothetical protein WCZ90_17185 [Melioribacteraceae bacterium]
MFRINFKLVSTIAGLLFLAQTLKAQQSESFIAEFTMSSNDAVKSSKITFVIEPNEKFDGYFVIPKHFNSIFGNAGHGGYDYLNYEEIGSSPEFLIPPWIDNDSPLLDDLEGFIKGSDSKIVLSFQIKPIYSKVEKSTKKVFLAKFAIINQEEKEVNNSIEISSKTKLYYKALKPTQSGILDLGFLQTVMPEYKFELTIKPYQKSLQTLNANSAIYSEIKKSLQDSNLDNTKFGLSTEIGVYPPKEVGLFKNVNCLKNYEQFNFTAIYNVASDVADTIKLANPIYLAELKFPFSLYNEDKMKQYSGYNTQKEILLSNYRVILVPMSYEKEKLTADVIVDYSKLNLNDGISRWSPFKKRLVFDHKLTQLEMPQENWSAVFTKGKDKYEIYGYSDYERYISEILFISLNKVYKEN